MTVPNHVTDDAPKRRSTSVESTPSGRRIPVDLQRQIAVLRQWLPLLVVSVLLAAVVALVVSNLLPKSYEAKATLIIGQSLSAVNPDYGQLQVSQRLATTYATVATTRPILAAVIRELDLDDTPVNMAKRVRADAPIDSTLLTISAQDSDPERAAAIANTLAEQLIEASPAIQGRQVEFQASIDADLKATQAQIAAAQARVETLGAIVTRTPVDDAELVALEGRLVSLRSTYATLLSFSSSNASNLLSVVEPAVAPITPDSPKPLLNTFLAAILGLLMASGVVFVAELLNDKIKDADAVQEVTNLSTLGSIAKMRGGSDRREFYRLASVLHPHSSVTEAYRTLRANIEFASVDAPVQTLLVTSSVPGEGKTVTAANLAVVFAQAGRRVLLVDADLRKPGVHSVFDVSNTHGLTSLLRTDDMSLGLVTHTTEQANLLILTAGPTPPNPAELLGSQRMRTILERLKAASDLIIFDSPPLQAVTDAAILSAFLDGTLFVIDAGRSQKRAVRLGREALDRAGANVLGAVLNRTTSSTHVDYAAYYGSDTRAGEGLRGSGESARSAP